MDIGDKVWESLKVGVYESRKCSLTFDEYKEWKEWKERRGSGTTLTE